MKILLSWLNDYIDTGLSADQTAEILSDLGFPLEGIDYLDNDAVLDVEISSNRGDCLGLIGIAREISVATGKPLKIPEVTLPESKNTAAKFTEVQIDEPELCRRYTARIIEGVKVGPSPDWLKNRLEALGLRSVNNIVDATNYAMLETSQPPHAFDYDKITDGKIIVRKAIPGERLTSIDGTKCELTPDMLIIADSQAPIAIAGVMGGLETEVSDATTTILLEDAHFDPVTVRTASRKLALPSDAAFRFERSVDIETIEWSSKRTAQLITQLAGGKAAKGVVDVYPSKPKPKKVTLRPTRLNNLLGIEVPPDRIIEILSALSLAPVQKGDSITCSIPSWRHDIYREADLIEEVARVHGYDKIPTDKKIHVEVLPVDPRQKLSQSLATFLNGCGFYETINVTFVDESVANLFSTGDHLAVKDASRKSANLLRQSLLGSLFTVLKTNLNAGNTPCRIFELADTFAHGDGATDERTMLAMVTDSDLRTLRGVVEGLIKTLDKNTAVTFKPADLPWADTGAQIMVDGDVLGSAGSVSKKVCDKFDLKSTTACGAEIDFTKLMALQPRQIKIKPTPRFPAIERDLSLIVNEDLAWDNILAVVAKDSPAELEDVRFVGIYRGKGIAAGKKSLTLSLRFRDDEGTLTHETVDKFEAVIVKNLTKSVAAELRKA